MAKLAMFSHGRTRLGRGFGVLLLAGGALSATLNAGCTNTEIAAGALLGTAAIIGVSAAASRPYYYQPSYQRECRTIRTRYCDYYGCERTYERRCVYEQNATGSNLKIGVGAVAKAFNLSSAQAEGLMETIVAFEEGKLSPVAQQAQVSPEQLREIFLGETALSGDTVVARNSLAAAIGLPPERLAEIMAQIRSAARRELARAESAAAV